MGCRSAPCDLAESFPDARAVFVLPHGRYRATGGRIERAIESDDTKFTIVSVRFDLPAKTTATVIVQP